MPKNFRLLSDPNDADPVRREHVEQYKCALLDAVALTELREAHERALMEGTISPSDAQVAASRIERQEDLYLQALGECVAELGGRLEVNAVFPNQTIRLVGAEERQPVEG